MRSTAVLTALAGCFSAYALATTVEADAKRGAEFFEKQKCNVCHSVGSASRAAAVGKAPDLAARGDREYTPAGITSRMWNHAPSMWSAIGQAGLQLPAVNEQDAADLFAFFYSARYFERGGDAARGKRAFSEKGCAECHSLAVGGASGGPAVSQWQSLRDPIALAQRMWNHTNQMRAATAKKKMAWPELTSQDLSDMLVYLQTLPEMRFNKGDFVLTAGGSGQQVFESKGCANCHKGAMALEKRLSNQTLTSIAASMWNHSPKMKQPGITLTEDEMRSLLSYVWGNTFFASQGSSVRGRKVFETKQCGSCHGQGVAPNIEGKAGFSDIALVSALWKHGPRMLAQLKQKNMAWPQLTPGQVADLVAYIGKPSGK